MMSDGNPSSNLRCGCPYIRNLSFSNPNAPSSCVAVGKMQPFTNVSVEVNAVGIQDQNIIEDTVAGAKEDSQEISVHELNLHFSIYSRTSQEERPENLVFHLDVTYCSIAVLSRYKLLSPEARERTLLVDGAQILFPHARHLVYFVTINGGFPPLMLDPIDFEQIYEQQRAKNRNAAKNPPDQKQ